MAWEMVNHLGLWCVISSKFLENEVFKNVRAILPGVVDWLGAVPQSARSLWWKGGSMSFECPML